MFSKIFKTLILISAFFSACAFADYYFDRGSHSFIFTSDMSFKINPTNSNYSIEGLGYYLNDSSTFYAISESDLNRAFNFNEGDEVRFVRRKKTLSEIKTTLWKEDKLVYENNIYKIGGVGGNSSIQFKVVAKPYQPSGQPLPAAAFTAIFALFGVGALGMRKKMRLAKR